MTGWLVAAAVAALAVWKPGLAQWAHDKLASLGAGRGGQ